MSGIDRLRTLAGAWDEWGLGGVLAETADEIERERAEDCYRMGLDCGTVWRVVADMERHCLGHEGMDDSPVARWARELRGALKSDASDGRDTQNPSCADPDGAADVTSEAQKVTRDHAEDVSVSAYDLLPEEDRDAIAWVLDADGVPTREGDTVWDTDAEADTPLTVVEVSSDLVRCEYMWKDGKTYRPCYPPDQLIHTKPEIDTWQRIEDDCTMPERDYYAKLVGHDVGLKDDAEIHEAVSRDLVRRCKELARKENNNE